MFAHIIVLQQRSKLFLAKSYLLNLVEMISFFEHLFEVASLYIARN